MSQNSFSLANGLELRVEPASDFLHSDVQDERGLLKVIKKRVRGIDISLFRNGKLCLSPQDNYYNLQEFEEQVLRPDLGQIPIEQYQRVIKRIAETIDLDLIRVYEILDFDLLPGFELKEREYILFDKNVNGLRQSNLFLLSDQPVEPDLINRCWMRQYGERDMRTGARFPDRLKGNAFSLFFVDPDFFSYERTFEQIAANSYHVWNDNSELVNLSNHSIHSLSYGYRMRLIGIDKETILASLT